MLVVHCTAVHCRAGWSGRERERDRDRQREGAGHLPLYSEAKNKEVVSTSYSAVYCRWLILGLCLANTLPSTHHFFPIHTYPWSFPILVDLFDLLVQMVQCVTFHWVNLPNCYLDLSNAFFLYTAYTYLIIQETIHLIIPWFVVHS